MALKKLSVEVGMNTSQFQRGLKGMQSGLNGMQSGMKAMQGRTSALSSGLQSIGTSGTSAMSALKMGAVATAAAIAGIVVVLKKLIDGLLALQRAFATFESSVYRVNSLFGDSAKYIQYFAENTAKALGMSESAAYEYAATYGNLFRSITADAQENSKVTIAMLKASAVVASKTGRTMEDVMERIRSGLLGNTEAIEDLGIQVNVAMLEMTDAFKKIANGRTWEQLTFYEQQQIRTLGILEQAHRNFGDSVQKGSAFTMQTLSSAFKDLTAIAGAFVNAGLQPIIQGLTQLVQWATMGLKALAALFGLQLDIGGVSTAGTEAQTAAQDGLTEAVEKTAKAQQKLAGFDEINTLPKAASGGSAAVGAGSSVFAGLPDPEFKISEPDTSWIDKVKEKFEKLKKLFEPAAEAFERLKEAVGKITEPLFAGLKWAYDNIFKPFAEWTISEALPRFLDTLAIGLEIVGKLIDEWFETYKQFYEEFLKPLAEYAAPKFLELWDKFNEKFKKLSDRIQSSKAFEDLRSILSKIYPILLAVSKKLVDVWAWFVDFQMSATFIELEYRFKNLEDAIGFVAAVLKGDFSDAWEHWKNLMLDNKIDKFREQFDLLKTKITEVKTAILDWVNYLKAQFNQAFTIIENKVKDWWDNHVAPWFTIEKWNELLQNMVNGFADGWNAVYDFFTISIPQWWSETIAPWFTAEKWIELWNNVKSGVASGWSAIVTFFTEAVPKWWNETIAPWFTKEKWVEILQGAKNAFVSVFDDIKNGIKSTLNSIIGFINKVISGLNALSSLEIPAIKGITDGFSFSLNIPEIPHLAEGGVLRKGQVGYLEGDGDEAVVPLEKNTGWIDVLASKLTAAMGGMQAAGAGNITVPVYIGNELIEEIVVNAGNNHNRKNNGRG